ncbi:MAG: hypothetical protein ACE5JS_14650 [Nitrospinota bacterium]
MRDENPYSCFEHDIESRKETGMIGRLFLAASKWRAEGWEKIFYLPDTRPF